MQSQRHGRCRKLAQMHCAENMCYACGSQAHNPSVGPFFHWSHADTRRPRMVNGKIPITMPHMRPSVSVATFTEDPTSMDSGDTTAICAADGASATVVAPSVDAAVDPAVMKQPESRTSIKAIAAAAKK